MVTPALKQDSNSVGLAWAEETSIGVLPGGPFFYSLDPNGFADFGGSIKTVARRPINLSRQKKKGTTVDLDASGGFGIDLTQDNVQELLQGFFFADMRRKAELAIASVKQAGGDEDYEPAAGGTAFYAKDLLWAKGFSDAGNNGLKVVVSSGAASVIVTTALTKAAVQTGTISRVGHEFAAGDCSVDVSGTYPKLVTIAKDLTQLGVIPGEWVYIGGDAALENFAVAGNNGYARVRSVVIHAMEFDKTQGVMLIDNGGVKTIRIYLGRVLKNESGTSIVRRSYQLERQLGAPDTAAPSDIQAEYLIGAIPNEMTLNIPSADKVTLDMSFVGIGVEQVLGSTGPKAATRPTLADSDAFNTSSDFSRIKMSVCGSATALFAFLTDMKITLKNNIVPNKAVGTLGAFDCSAGTFDVAGSVTAYFADIAAVAAVWGNSDITLDFMLAKANHGIAIDIPMICLGDGRPKVDIDKPITLPLTLDAASGAKALATQDHTLLMVFFDYLPTVAC
jgi:hypothetical protein